MATITPTSDQRQTFNVTTFQIGDQVQAVSGPDAGKIGVIATPDGTIPTEIPNPTPPPATIVVYQPVSLPPVPLGVRAQPTTNNVKVVWTDGTTSTVPLSSLGKVPGQ